ncbi:hypothetical protein Tco_0739734 [Tanacetum coccineum]
MTTPRPTHFSATTPCAEVFAPFVIISDSDDEITTLPVRPAPLSPDHASALYGDPLDSGDDSSDEDLKETAESLHTQTTSTLVIDGELHHHPPVIPEIPSPSSPPSLLPSSSSPPPSLLSSSSRKRSRSPSPSPPPSVSPSPLPSPPPSAAPPPPPEHIESVRDDIETVRVSLASAMQKTMTLRARVGLLEQHNVDSEASRARAEAVEHRAETLQVSPGAAQMDVRDLIESREANKFEMAELRRNNVNYESRDEFCRNREDCSTKWPGFTLSGQLARVSHMAKDCRAPARAANQGNQNNQRNPPTCFGCGQKGIIGMNVQTQKTRPEATRIREAEMEESMVKETKMGIKLMKTLAS